MARSITFARLACLVLLGVGTLAVRDRFAPVPGNVAATFLLAQSGSFPAFTHVTVDPDGSAPSNSHCKAIGDLNGDGYPDLVVASSTAGGPMVWYQSPNWTKHVISTLGGWSTNMQVADLNGDGRMDVIIPVWYRSGGAGDENGLEWWENAGAGVSWVRHYIGLPQGHDVEVADLDADGLPDLVTRLQGGEGVSVEIWRAIALGRDRSVDPPDRDGPAAGGGPGGGRHQRRRLPRYRPRCDVAGEPARPGAGRLAVAYVHDLLVGGIREGEGGRSQRGRPARHRAGPGRECGRPALQGLVV